MNIFYQFNEKYVPYAGVSMTSLFYNNKTAKSICVYILGEDLSENSIGRIRKLADEYGREVRFVDTTNLVAKMKELNMPTYRGSYAANMRLFVTEILGCEDRLLYLDADTIVTGDVSEIYNLPIKTVGMVYDTLGCFHKYGIGLSEEDGYYNSGMILYDLNKWKQGKYTEKIIDHVTNVRAAYPSPDQDLLNIVLAGQITALPFGGNFQPHLRDYPYDLFMKCFEPSPFYTGEEVEEAASNPVILHAFRYIGEFPWHEGNLHPFNEEFDKYLKMSPWSDYVKEVADNGIVIKTEKLMYRILPQAVFLWIFKIMHGRFYRKADKLSKQNRISSKM